jgi:hypothetical protein
MESDVETKRGAEFRNAVLTIVLFAPLLWTFWRNVSFYPLTAWSAFSEASPLGTGAWTYYVLKGETVDYRTIEVPAASITNALYGRNDSMTRLVEENASFTMESPHPDNVRMWALAGTLPPSALMNDLLMGWGKAYNLHQPAGSPNILHAIRLEQFEWPRVDFNDFARRKKTWRVELPPE